MARLIDDKIGQPDELITQQLEQNVKSVVDELQPVDAIILPDGKPAVVNNNNDIVPIGGQNTAGTINQDGNIVFIVNSNESDSLIYVNGENTFKTAPTKLFYTLGDVLKTGEIVITSQKRDVFAPERYRITVVQNPNFNDTTFDSYQPVVKNIDGLLSVEPDVNKQIFTKTPPYSFKIEYYAGDVLQNSDVTIDNQTVRDLSFNFTANTRLPNIPVDDIAINVPTFNLTVSLTGPNRSVNIEKADGSERRLLDSGNTVFIADSGADFVISSVNPSLYRVVNVQYVPENGKSAPVLAEAGENLVYRFTLTANSVLNIQVEEITVAETTITSLSLVSSESLLKYNINSKADLPLVVRANGNVTSITAYIKDKQYTFTKETAQTETLIIIPSVAFDTIGNYKLILVPTNITTQGTPLELSIAVIDEVFVGVPDLRNIVYPKEIVGADYSGTNVDFEISYDSIDTDFVRIYVNNSTGYFREKASGVVNFNFQKLLEYVNYDTPANDKIISIVLKLVPYNVSGQKEVIGKEEIISINFQKSDLEIPRSVAINRIAEGFLNQLDSKIFDGETNKYLTHLLHLGDANNKVITTWLGDRGTIIYKLYEPLETSIQPNQELWVSKVISTPIIETITIVGEEEVICNTLKGPNFSLQPDNGIEFQVYDTLVASGSVSSTSLVTNFALKNGIDTSKITIQYTSGSEYVFENFINFSSATERLENFVYKVKLLEFYDTKLTELGSSINAFSLVGTSSIAETNEVKKIQNSILEIKSNFDGYEKYLYYTTNSDSNNLAYPKTNPSSSILLNTTNSSVKNWYDIALNASELFDKYNPNKLSNNIPRYIIESPENSDFVIFMDMLGQHFDTIWLYIKSLANTKELYENSLYGISNDMVIHMLESLGWNSKRAFDSNFLWEYVFGQYQDGSQKYSKPLKSANEEVWRRILNNLPYILKHKGTGRAMKAVMACYGVPQSMLTIMEFGGPQDPVKGGSTEFTFDDRTSAYYLSGSSSVKVPWVSSSLSNDYPNCIELRIKPDRIPNTIYTLISGSEWTLDLVQTTGSFGKLELNFGGDQALSEYVINTYFDILYAYGPDYKTGSLDFPISTEHYSNVAINRYNYPDSSSLFEVWLGTSDGNRIITSVSMSILSLDTQWSSGSYIQIGGNGYQGNIDEFRLWTVPLQRSKFNNHTLFPDAINGNSYTASTSDLLFRLDFEYPKDRNIDPYIKNVAISDTYGHESATASFTYVAPNYPYQHTPYDRTVTATVPSLGFGYSNKIRFESASLVTDLSYKTRATKKSFDQAPIDSNRLGLFFSPIKEVNMDILKTFGDFNIDNYIGDYSDEYKDEYRTLSKLRNYYFQRMERNVDEYIRLVRYIDKSLFDVLADLAPARAKISKGLLIEPHFLERSKTRWSKPTSERNDHESSISLLDTNQIESSYEVKEGELNNQDVATLEGNLNNYDGVVAANDVYVLEGTNPNYEGLVDYNVNEIIEANAPFYDTFIQALATGSNIVAEVDSFNSVQIGMDRNSLENLGFGLYAKNGSAVIRTWDGLFGNTETTGSRKSVFLVKEETTKKISTQVTGYPVNGALPGDQVRYENLPVTFENYKVSVQPYGANVTLGNGVVEATAINGYLPTHYKFKFMPEGIKRSYYKGSYQTAATTPDGLSPVETFTTNPNILRVAKTGRGSGEPILEVD
jgi:hypothetical protein